MKEKQLNVWIDSELKDALVDRAKREHTSMKRLVEGILGQDIARMSGNVIEQQAMPIVRDLVQSELRRSMVQLRSDLRDDMETEIVEPIQTMMHDSHKRLASLAGRAVRHGGLIQRMLIALASKLVSPEYAQEIYEDAKDTKEKAGQELYK